MQYRHFKSYPQKSKSYPPSYPHIHIIHKNRHESIICRLKNNFKNFKKVVDNTPLSDIIELSKGDNP